MKYLEKQRRRNPNTNLIFGACFVLALVVLIIGGLASLLLGLTILPCF